MAISEAALYGPDLARNAAFYAIVVCWWIFCLTFWLRRRPSRAREAKRDWTSLVGLLLQALAYFCVWFYPLQRQRLSPSLSGPPPLEWVVAVLSVSIATASVWLINVSARRLGKQWALAARLVEGHALIQDGPYRYVRNPIYVGMLGMLVATGLAAEERLPLLIAIVIFAVGTYIRIQSEQRLLRQAFGEEFDKYARNVRALIPGIF